MDYQIGLVDYKDVDSTSPGCPPDYDAVVDLPFSNNPTDIVNALNALPGKVGGGCDIPEDVYSGVKKAIDFPWRTGAKKAIIVMGNAPGHDPEAHSGLTLASIVAAAKAVDPAIIYSVLVGNDPTATSFMAILAKVTGGTTFDSRSGGVGQAIVSAITTIVLAPTANAGGPYLKTLATTLV